MASTRTHVPVAEDYLVKIAEENGTTPPPPPASRRPPREGGGDPTWPYGDLPESLGKSQPRWTCPAGLCACREPGDEVDTVIHTVFLHDDASRRMPGARCRVHGAAVHAAPAYAASDGSLAIEVHELPERLVLEWAPADTPLEGPFPFRCTYALDLGGRVDEQVRRRLDNLGFTRATTLKEKVESFQRSYALPIDGEPQSVLPVLLAYHDQASLPALVEAPDPERPGQLTRRPGPPGPPDPRPPSQGCVAAVENFEPCTCHFSFVIFDERSQSPMANASYVIDAGLSVVHYGACDGSGRLEHGDVPAGDYRLHIGGVTMTIPAIGKDETLRPLLLIPDR